MTIVNKCFVCSSPIEIEIEAHHTHDKIDLCSKKCIEEFKKRLVDKDEEKDLDHDDIHYNLNLSVSFHRRFNSPVDISSQLTTTFFKFLKHE